MDPITFNLRPDIVPKILDDLCDPDLTLREIAEKARTTVDALSIWMASPEIQARINLIQSTMAMRTRLAATCFLPSAVRTVNRLINEYNDEESHVPIRPGSLMGHEYRRRSRESARRACNLLLRLARFYHEPCHGLGRVRGGGGHARDGAKPAPDLISERASRVGERSPSLDDLLAQAAAVAPGLNARAGVAGSGEPPASANRDRAPTLEPRTAHDTEAVQVPVPHIDLNPPPPPVIHTNGNGLIHTTNPNEHWP